MLLALILSVSTFIPATTAEAEKFSIVIYTPTNENYRIVPIWPDYTFDMRSKADFDDGDLSTSRQWKIPHVWTGDLTWNRKGDAPNPRTFWITDKATGEWNRDMLMCPITLESFPTEDVWLYLGSEHSWAFTGENDDLGEDWFWCDNYMNGIMPFVWPTASNKRPK